MHGHPQDNPNQLRVIMTGRTEAEINAAADAGMNPLVQPVTPSPKMLESVGIYQHRVTRRIVVNGDCRWKPEKEHERVLSCIGFYPYHFPEPFAAYLLPADLEVGETVWLEDIIEDIVAAWAAQGGNPRLECGEATWDGEKFVVHFDPATDAPEYVG